MADNAISGINPYLMSSNSALMNDPYFLAAYKSPNYYQLAAAQTQQGQTAGQTTTTVATAPQQQVTQPQTAEKSSHKGLAAGLILAAGATALCIAAHGKGNKKLDLIPRIGDGFKNMWKSVTKTVGEFFGKSSDTFKVFEKNGEKVCNIPGKTNRLYGKNLTTEELKKIGETAEVRALMNESGKAFAEGSQLYYYTFEHKGLEITVTNGKLSKIMNGSENVLAKYKNSSEAADIAIKTEIDELISKFSKGENLELLKNIKYKNVQNNVTRYYTLGTIGDEAKLTGIVTKDFAIDSPAVNLYKSNNPAAEKILQENTQ